MIERALVFPCEGEQLIGVVTEPDEGMDDLGVVVVVGGPQYRVGSHRQFVHLARDLADSGIPCLRFDYRGMGDATGDMRDFESVSSDIRAAVDAFIRQLPSVRRVVLWGLCDGASAACFYASTDSRVAGMVLLNPWVTTAQGQARTYLRHYYAKRLLDPAFWKKLFKGGVSLQRSVGGLLGAAKDATNAGSAPASLPDRVATGLRSFGAPVCIVLSGNDFVAREFESAFADAARRSVLEAATVHRFADADHTFSSQRWRGCVSDATVAWIKGLPRPSASGQDPGATGG